MPMEPATSKKFEEFKNRIPVTAKQRIKAILGSFAEEIPIEKSDGEKISDALKLFEELAKMAIMQYYPDANLHRWSVLVNKEALEAAQEGQAAYGKQIQGFKAEFSRMGKQLTDAYATIESLRLKNNQIPEEAGYISAYQKMQQMFPTQNNGFISEATWAVLEAYLGHSLERK